MMEKIDESKLTNQWKYGGSPRPIFIAYIGDVTEQQHKNIKKKLVDDLPEYYVIIVNHQKDIRFEALYPSDFNEIDLAGLEAKLKEAIV